MLRKIWMVVCCCLRIFLKNNYNNKNKKMEEQKKQTNNSTPKVTGIGGIFFFSDNTKEIKEWYAKNLGFEINDWGTVSFEYRDVNKPDQVIPLQWSPFKKD